ncbi:exonuclease phage-type/recb c-terminal domain-containing protein [Holotrichia oblita]|uniref:Exonuclease phage-type/recb c-terminal domain-containing protein n=1 Tax=Holotrichia oblita TaxID=644536 RepID=A0ACB9SLU6_HOLOL|nr:exonuclease phage-type/recb c-terminal domain-containing protein [Holotrichia oblita]
MVVIHITFADILTYVGERKRPLIEGEAVFKANHIFSCGINNENTNIFALCTRSSAASASPHEININLIKWECKCSCKAGAGGYCKHVIATLFYVNKTTTYKDKIETEVLNNVFLDSIAINIKNYNLSDCCLNVIHQLELAEIISDCPQRSPEWKNIRQLRITGSRCYSLYTFKDDWIKKAENYFWPKEYSSIYTSHGNFFEKHALAAYKNKTQCDIWVPNFVVPKLFPWLGVSPDGVSFVHGQPTQLLEIKCPYSGKDLSAHEFMDGCSYINVSDTGELVLKENHQYYAQVQLGMAILNLKAAELMYLLVSKKRSHCYKCSI